jgi:hypothetical protein
MKKNKNTKELELTLITLLHHEHITEINIKQQPKLKIIKYLKPQIS